MPAAFIPVFASSPASTIVTKAGPSSGSHSSTTAVSKACVFQSQFWPTSTGRPSSGTAANAVHSRVRGSTAAALRALAANITSVRTLIAITASNGTPAPSAMPRISSAYCRP